MRSGIIAIVGRANVGKSTLMNRILEEKVSIVTHVAQTTRNLIRGIRTESRGQLVLLDTPGVHKATHDLGKLMNRAARQAVQGVDGVLLVLDGSTPPRDEDEGWMRKLMRTPADILVAVNKSDIHRAHRRTYETLWAAMEKDAAPGKQDTGGRKVPWLSVSGATGRNLDSLINQLFRMLPKGPALFPADVLTDFPRRWNMADVIREKLMQQLREELPHSVAVHIEHVEEDERGLDIRALIYVNRQSQKIIVIGEKGRGTRKVQRQAEAELAAIYDKPVRVRLWVKVQKDWARNHWILKQMGYV